MLASLVALVVLMPVSYRAGTDTSHSHSIFQGLIDMVIGQPHHHSTHHRDKGHVSIATDSEASGTSDQDGHPAGRLEPKATGPDMPALLGLSVPIDAAASIHALGALLAAILCGSGRRSLWRAVHRASGLIPALDPPPPRRA